MRNTFPTQTGYCHVYPDKVVLNGFPEDEQSEDNIPPAQPRKPIFYLYLVAAVACFVIAFLGFRAGSQAIAAVGAIIGFLAIKWLVGQVTKTDNLTVLRAEIEQFRFVNGKPPLTKAFFIMKYRDDRGRSKNKIIALTTNPSEIKAAKAKAMEVVEQAELLDR